MKRFLLFWMFVLGSVGLGAQEASQVENVKIAGKEYAMRQPIHLGRNVMTGDPLSGEVYDFGSRVDHTYIDSLSRTATVQLRDSMPNGKYLRNRGILLVLDLEKGQVRWDREIVYPNARSGVTQQGDFLMYHDGRKTACLDLADGRELWESRYDFWHVLLDSSFRIGFGYPSSGIESIFGIDLHTGERLWKRRFPMEPWNDVIRLDDTTVLIFASGFYQFNLKTGEGWNYQAQTSKRNDQGRQFLANALGIGSAIFLGSGFFMWGGYDQIQGLYSDPLITDDRIYFSCADRMVALDRGGNLCWEWAFPEQVASYSHVFERDSVVYLVGRGFAFIQGQTATYGRPLFAAYDSRNGDPLFSHVIDQRKCQIRAFKPYRDSMIFVTEDRIDCRNMQDGNSVREVLVDTVRYGAMIRDVDPEHYFRRDPHTGRFTRAIGSQDAWGVYTTRKKLLLLDEQQRIAEVLEMDSLYYLCEKRDNLSLLRKDSTNYLIDDNGQLRAELNSEYAPRWIDDYWYIPAPTGLIRIDIGDMVGQRYDLSESVSNPLLTRWAREPEYSTSLID